VSIGGVVLLLACFACNVEAAGCFVHMYLQ